MLPTAGDLLIRDVAASPGEFMLVDADTQRSLAGPFASLQAALAAAKSLRPTGKVWKEHCDSRGRVLGPPLELPVQSKALSALLF